MPSEHYKWSGKRIDATLGADRVADYRKRPPPETLNCHYEIKLPSNNHSQNENQNFQHQSLNSNEGNLSSQINCSIQSANGTVLSCYSDQGLGSNHNHENNDNQLTRVDRRLGSSCSIQSTFGTVQNSCTGQMSTQKQNMSSQSHLSNKLNSSFCIQSTQDTMNLGLAGLTPKTNYDYNGQLTKQDDIKTTSMQNRGSSCEVILTQGYDQRQVDTNTSESAIKTFDQCLNKNSCCHQHCSGGAICNSVQYVENSSGNPKHGALNAMGNQMCSLENENRNSKSCSEDVVHCHHCCHSNNQSNREQGLGNQKLGLKVKDVCRKQCIGKCTDNKNQVRAYGDNNPRQYFINECGNLNQCVELNTCCHKHSSENNIENPKSCLVSESTNIEPCLGNNRSNQDLCLSKEASNRKQCLRNDLSNHKQGLTNDTRILEQCLGNSICNQNLSLGTEASNHKQCLGNTLNNHKQGLISDTCTQKQCIGNGMTHQDTCVGHDCSNHKHCSENVVGNPKQCFVNDSIMQKQSSGNDASNQSQSLSYESCNHNECVDDTGNLKHKSEKDFSKQNLQNETSSQSLAINKVSNACWYFHAQVENLEMPLLFDTGSPVSILSKETYERMCSDKPLLTTIETNLLTANGTQLEILGQGTFKLKTEVKTYEWKFLVANLEGNMGIIGQDFIDSQGRSLK